MTTFEYKVVPAPQRGQKARGVKGGEARFALALERVMNEMAEGGWEYQRSDTLPCEERQGLSGNVVTYRNVLVFRRARAEDVASFQPRKIEADTAPRALPPADLPPADLPAASASDLDEPEVEPIRPARPARRAEKTRPDLALVHPVQTDDTREAVTAEPEAPPRPMREATSPGPALLARARQLAARAKSDVAAE